MEEKDHTYICTPESIIARAPCTKQEPASAAGVKRNDFYRSYIIIRMYVTVFLLAQQVAAHAGRNMRDALTKKKGVNLSHHCQKKAPAQIPKSFRTQGAVLDKLRGPSRIQQ